MKPFSSKLEFGGSLLRGKRKSRRPLDFERPIHLVLKATSSNVLLHKVRRIERIAGRFAKKFDVRIYQFGVHADHIHVALRVTSREGYVRWIRAFASLLVQQIPGLKWGLRPYTRIAAWGRGFRRLCQYVLKNKIEGKRILAAFGYVERCRAEAFGVT